MINRTSFYASVRHSFGRLRQTQVEGFEMILNQWEGDSSYVDYRWLAYTLATAWHETASTMQAIEEYGKGAGKPYGKPDPVTGKKYYGRGLVQLTWPDNYKKMSKILYGDLRLYADPALALDLQIASNIMFEGMTTGKSFHGDFTNKHLGMYFNKVTDDPFQARRIINGLDRAKLIAGYHDDFLIAIAA